MRQSIAKHPKLPESGIDRLVNDKGPKVRLAVIDNPKIAKEHLTRLSKDDYAAVALTSKDKLKNLS